MDVKVYRQDGTDTGRIVTLDPAVFEARPSDHAIWLDVKSIQANARQGTHKAKDRGEVAGSTRKLYRQKGTGGARAGSARSGTRRSGGTIFGPQPRDYVVAVNRKTKRLARRSAIAYKTQADAIRVVEGLIVDTPSTKLVAGLLKGIGVSDRKVLLLTDVVLDSVYRSGRNIAKLRVRDAATASTLDIMEAQVLVILESALPVLSAVLGDTATADAEPATA